ncbi:MAG: hypothetical protein GY913_15495 [Proteobacteria bacterium]|nr:hypothetical protein [Pseudomonadota bacterium]MCP4918313.1 hypothetical protein [Pseudomonadota bacterium]
MLFLLLGSVSAASLDTVEVGGPFGSPTSRDATATWWNPAGLAWKGTRFTLEAAPTWGTLTMDREAPNPGSQSWSGSSVIPFIGVAHSPRRGPSFGASLAIPYATGGQEQERGVGSFSMRSGSIVAAYGLAGMAMAPTDWLAVGATVAGVRTSWSSTVDMDTVPDLHDGLLDMGEVSPYTDADLEDVRYAATAQFQGLTGSAVTGGLGLALQGDHLRLGAAFHKGTRVINSGQAEIQFGCPPSDDAMGRFGAEAKGVCHSRVAADARSITTLPSRVHLGLTWAHRDVIEVSALGGWVGWSADDEMRIELSNVAERNPQMGQQAAEAVEGVRVREVGARDTVFGGLDVKGRPNSRLLLGGRVLYDQAAIPSDLMSPSSADFESLRISGLAAVDVRPGVELSLSATGVLAAPRTITDSRLGVSIDQPGASELAYPHGNGIYSKNMGRVGLGLRIHRIRL